MKRNQQSQRDQHLDRTHGEDMMNKSPEPQLVEEPILSKQEQVASKRLDVREANVSAREASMLVKEADYAEAVKALNADRELLETEKQQFEQLKASQDSFDSHDVEDVIIAKLKEFAGHLPPQIQAMLNNPQLAVAAVEAMLATAKTELTNNGARFAVTTPFGILRAEAYLEQTGQTPNSTNADSADDLVWLKPVNGRVRCESFTIEL